MGAGARRAMRLHFRVPGRRGKWGGAMKANAAERISAEILIVLMCIIPVAVLAIFNLPGLGAIAAIVGAGLLYIRSHRRHEHRLNPRRDGPLEDETANKTAA